MSSPSGSSSSGVILEIGQDPSVAYAGRLLSRTGSRVLLVEPPGSRETLRARLPLGSEPAGLGATARYLDHGKQSIALGSDEAAAAQLLGRLVEHCDGVIADRVSWQRYHAVLKANSVHLTVISPFGLDGPYADRPATPATIFAAGGEASILPGGLGHELFPNEPPLTVPGQVADLDAGTIGALVSSASAFAALDKPGFALADVSKVEAQVSLNRWLVSHYALSGWIESRETRAYSYGGLLGCADGYVMLQPTTNDHWRRLVEVLGSKPWMLDPALDTVEGREEQGEAIQDAITAWSGSRTRAQVFAEAFEAGVPVAPFQTVDEVLNCEQYLSRGYFADYPGSEGPLPVPGIPFAAHPQAAVDDGAAPERGAHTRAVLRELLGLDDADIDKLVARGALEAAEDQP